MRRKILVGTIAATALGLSGALVAAAAADDDGAGQPSPARSAAAGATAAGPTAGPPSTPPSPSAATEITMDHAVQIALAVVPDSRVLEADLEREDGRLVWEVELAAAGVKHEVYVDARTGVVVKSEADRFTEDDRDDHEAALGDDRRDGVRGDESAGQRDDDIWDDDGGDDRGDDHGVNSGHDDDDHNDDHDDGGHDDR